MILLSLGECFRLILINKLSYLIIKNKNIPVKKHLNSNILTEVNEAYEGL